MIKVGGKTVNDPIFIVEIFSAESETKKLIFKTRQEAFDYINGVRENIEAAEIILRTAIKTKTNRIMTRYIEHMK